ncbi:DUF4350 domain-containing protein [Gramella sp. AN32]|uniref:DUF4350 domain-containing protein n=1 Tax=Christiangramia antarctica TaxID=2058158 RepID=A0ABW5X833_9FLAO|nr:DUF4350 domain-containing protein [Gramella sp. AN32]MCM4156587.1 DUF4350 domain-containing protein [Gramella sp. AN32]
MNKTYKIAFGLFLLLVISLVYLEASEPEPLNWNPSYTSSDKIPLGAYVFYDLYKDQNSEEFQEVKIPPYEFLQDSSLAGTYFFLNDYVAYDKDELDDLLEWVSRGNDLFISAYHFGSLLQDTLKISMESTIVAEDGFTSRPSVNLVNPALKFTENLLFDQDLPGVYFSEIDTLNQTILGTASFSAEKEEVNFIKTQFGEGTIYLHATPQAFSNYFLLKEGHPKYAARVLSYVKQKPIFWDAYYKSGKSYFTSPLFILLNNRALKWAYYFVLIASGIFILFEGKRKQRAIPVVEPLQNKSYDFIDTVSNLYLEEKKFSDLGNKKIQLFQEYIRTQYRINLDENDDQGLKDLATKSENSYEDTKALFIYISRFQNKNINSKTEFLELTQKINSYKLKNGKSGK